MLKFLPPQKRLRLVLWGIAALLLLGALSAVLSLSLLFWYYGRDIREIDQKALQNYRPPQVTRIYARDGKTLIGEVGSQRRSVVSIAQIPDFLEKAFLAAEDAEFYEHQGMDYTGMVRALLANLRAGKVRQGASTITQQVVKNFILSPERSLRRKVQELILARRLETVLSKKEILRLYLNDVYFGSGAYGVQEASRTYFGKSIDAIDLGQAAMLAGLLKYPSAASPLNNPQKAVQRQRYVLQQMVENGFARPEEVQPFVQAGIEGLGVVDGRKSKQLRAGAEEFVDAVLAELKARYGKEELDRLGASVTTTVDLELQREAKAAVLKGLRELDQRQGLGRATKVATKQQQQKARSRLSKPPKKNKEYLALVSKAPAGLNLPPSAIALRVGQYWAYLPLPAEKERLRDAKLPPPKQWVEGGVMTVKLVAPKGDKALRSPEGDTVYEAKVDPLPQACAVLTDNQSGEVLAMVGAAAYRRGDFNRVLRAHRQPGSAFKPFVYGAALQSQHYTPATLVSDSPEIYKKWKPTNFEANVYRGEVRLRSAMTHSINTVAIKLVDELGPETVAQFAKQAGIEAKLHPHLSLALGTSEVTPFDLMGAYLTLARGGSRLLPSYIKEIRNDEGDLEASYGERKAIRTLPADLSYVLTSMMQSVIRSGTGRKAVALGRPAAGKTGTSAELRDAWFAGFTPRHVAVAWVGYDTPRKIGRKETGGRAALPIWLQMMQAAEKGKAPLPFVMPPGVEVRRIDALTGLLAPENAGESKKGGPGALQEVFLDGTAPMEYAPESGTKAADAVLDLYED